MTYIPMLGVIGVRSMIIVVFFGSDEQDRYMHSNCLWRSKWYIHMYTRI
jgi:hypothetical protein